MPLQGSKARHAARSLLLPGTQEPRTIFAVEPFVGGGNVINRVTGPRIGIDVNAKMIALLDAIGNRDWCPRRQ